MTETGELRKFIRDEKNQPIGMIVSPSPGRVGWSLCNVKGGDRFNKGKALIIARSRAEHAYEEVISKVPEKIKPEVVKMLLRSCRSRD